MGTIGLIAAMPDETRPFLRIAGPAVRFSSGMFSMWRLRTGKVEVCLVESGMGVARASAATDALVAAASPAVILSFGFGGAALPGLRVGDLVLGMESWFVDTGRLVPRPGIDRKLTEELALELGRIFDGVASGEIITSQRILRKGDLAHSLPTGITSPILDMETAAVAEAAQRLGIPLVALRSISDDASEELAFSLDEFTGDDMAIRPMKVMATIARKPWIIPQLLRLARNSHIAGERLAQGVLSTIEFISRRL